MLEALGKFGRWDYLTGNRWLKHTDKYCRREDFSVTAYEKDCLKKDTQSFRLHTIYFQSVSWPRTQRSPSLQGCQWREPHWGTRIRHRGRPLSLEDFFFKHKTWTLRPRSSRRASFGPTCPFLCLLMQSRKSPAEEPQTPTRWRTT